MYWIERGWLCRGYQGFILCNATLFFRFTLYTLVQCFSVVLLNIFLFIFLKAQCNLVILVLYDKVNVSVDVEKDAQNTYVPQPTRTGPLLAWRILNHYTQNKMCSDSVLLSHRFLSLKPSMFVHLFAPTISPHAHARHLQNLTHPLLPSRLLRPHLLPTTQTNSLIHNTIHIVNLIRQHCALNKRFPWWRHHHLQHRIHARRRHKAQEPTKLVWPITDTDMNIFVNGVDKARHVRCNADQKSGNSAPVPALCIAVNAVVLIQSQSVVFTTMHDPKVDDHNGRNRAQENGISAHEIEKGACAR